MQAGADIGTYLLAAGVIALFGLFFLFVLLRFIGAGRQISNYLDSSSARRRAALEHEARFGKPPFWLRLVRGTFVVSAFGLMAVLLWKKYRLQ